MSGFDEPLRNKVSNPHIRTPAAPAILLPMQTDPVEESRRLAALYAEMGNIEIQELAHQINDLTPAAQVVLRDELKKRGVTDPQFAPKRNISHSRTLTHFTPASEEVDESIEEIDEDTSVEYSWKTLLCECADMPEARAIARVLMAAGLESWIERSPQYGETAGPKVVVAADQLEHARHILEQPIRQDILEEERELQNAPQYELPTCPHCGAPVPILESVEPSNNWLCESCDHTWSDPIPESAREQGTASDA